MEEDVLGPREDVVGDRYTRCTRCGTVVPIEEAKLTLVEGAAVATEQAELCQACRDELESGEGDWVVPDEETA